MRSFQPIWSSQRSAMLRSAAHSSAAQRSVGVAGSLATIIIWLQLLRWFVEVEAPMMNSQTLWEWYESMPDWPVLFFFVAAAVRLWTADIYRPQPLALSADCILCYISLCLVQSRQNAYYGCALVAVPVHSALVQSVFGTSLNFCRLLQTYQWCALLRLILFISESGRHQVCYNYNLGI